MSSGSSPPGPLRRPRPRAPKPSGFSRTAGSTNSPRCSTVPSGNQQTVDVLKQLAAQHNQQRKAQSITDSRYEIRWEKSAAGAARAEGGEGSAWLLIGDDAAAVPPLVDALTARGHRHRILGLPVSEADEQRLAAALQAAVADEPTIRIVHLSALDSDTAPSTQSLLRMQHQVLGGTRRLFRAAAAAELRTPIWLITRGAQRVTSADTVSPAQSCLWGFGRAASLEHPRLWGGLADLSQGGADEWSRLIDQLVAAPTGEDQIALRDQAVYVPRLTRRAGQPSATPPALRDDATYLVTGGLGAIGLEVAGYLAAHGARHLVLTSRRAPSDAARQRIDAIREQNGCDVRVIAADVADPHDVARVLSTVRAELPPLAGIVHAAGEIGTTPLRNLGRRRSGPSVRREGLGCLEFERGHRRDRSWTSSSAPRRLPRYGAAGGPDRLQRGQRLPRRVGLAASVSRAFPESASTSVRGRSGHGRRGRPRATG